jgi:hypothetical protein
LRRRLRPLRKKRPILIWEISSDTEQTKDFYNLWSLYRDVHERLEFCYFSLHVTF